MPVQANIPITRYSDGVLTIEMSPPASLGGATLQFDLMKRFGGTPTVSKYLSSGYNGASGMTLTNSGQGIVNINLYSVDTSGKDFGNYAFTLRRTDSGLVTTISEGFVLNNP